MPNGADRRTLTAPAAERSSGARSRASTRSRYATAPGGGSSAISSTTVSPARTGFASVSANCRGRPLARSYHATRTKASRTVASRTSMVARNAERSGGTGKRSLSMPHARPPGTPTSSSGPSRPNEPRGVVRRNRPSSSAATASATTWTMASEAAMVSRSFRTRGPYPSTRVASVLHSCEDVAHSCARCRTNVRGLVSGQLHGPGADLEGLQPRSREVAVDLERRGGPDDVEPGVAEVRLPFTQIDRPGRTDRPSETQRGGGLLALPGCEAGDERSVRFCTPRGQDGKGRRV